MKSKDFDWQTNEFMLYCRTAQLKSAGTYSIIQKTPQCLLATSQK